MAAGLNPASAWAAMNPAYGSFLFSDQVVGARRGRAGGFADEHQQLDRRAGPLGEPRERDVAERRESLEDGVIEEVERDLAAAHDGAEAVREDASRREALDQPDLPDVACREATLVVGHDDPRVDQPAKFIGTDAGPTSSLGELISLHGPRLYRVRPRCPP